MDAGAPISVVIPSWNCLSELRACLDSVSAQGAGAAPLVIDNGSADGTVAFLEREAIPHVALPSNVGFAAAVNHGVACSETPFVMVLNADAVLERGCLERLAAGLSGDRRLGGVQPLILRLERGVRGDPGPESVVYSLGQCLTRDGRALELGAGGRLGELAPLSREIFGACGAACLLRREMLDALGGYEERYFAFYEDVDLNVRARIAGWRFRSEPGAVAWHVGNVAWRSGFARPLEENARLVARNRLATQIKFMSPRSIPRIGLVEVGAIARAASRRRLRATVAGKLEALHWIKDLLRQRRRLRDAGDVGLARAWLGADGSGSRS
jgi:hypothetical protein